MPDSVSLQTEATPLGEFSLVGPELQGFSVVVLSVGTVAGVATFPISIST